MLSRFGILRTVLRRAGSSVGGGVRLAFFLGHHHFSRCVEAISAKQYNAHALAGPVGSHIPATLRSGTADGLVEQHHIALQRYSIAEKLAVAFIWPLGIARCERKAFKKIPPRILHHRHGSSALARDAYRRAAGNQCRRQYCKQDFLHFNSPESCISLYVII